MQLGKNKIFIKLFLTAILLGGMVSTAHAIKYYVYQSGLDLPYLYEDSEDASFEFGRQYNLVRDITFTPYAGLDYVRTDLGGFSESGSFADLEIDSGLQESLYSSLGFRLSNTFDTENGARYQSSMYVVWENEYGDGVSEVTAAFSDSPSEAFKVTGAELPSDRLKVGFAVAAKINQDANLVFGYDKEFDGGDGDQSLNASFRLLW